MNRKHAASRIGNFPAFDRAKLKTRIEALEPRSYLSATFSPASFTTNVRGVTGIAAADLNGDGQPDIVVAGLSPTTANTAVVGVYPDQSGNFGTPTLYPAGSQAGGVALGDFEANGHQDIATIDPSDNHLISFINDGSGDFSPAAGATLPGTGGDTSIVSADFRGDGKDDVAVADPNDNEVVIAFSNGDGSFAVQTPIGVADPEKIVAADFNGDGHPDLAILSGQSPNTLYIAMNNGNGSFAAPTAYTFGSGVATINDIAAADFNGDGKADVVGVGSSDSGGVAAVLINQGPGLFTSVNDLALPATADTVATGNFSGSGHIDIAALDTSGSLDLLAGNGDGTFAAAQSVSSELSTPGNQAVTADFDGNGQPDIAFVSRSQGGFGTLLNSTGASPTAAIVPTLSGKLPTRNFVSGGKIAPIAPVVTLTASSAFNGSVTIDFQLSLTNSFNANNPTVTSVTRKLSLKAGRSARVAVPIRSLPAGLQGSYYVVAQVTDPNGGTAAGASAQTLSVLAPTIDLGGGRAILPRSGKAGHTAAVTYTVSNSGTITANVELPVAIFASTTGALDTTAITAASFTRHVVIPAGKSIRLASTVTLPTTAGSYYMIIELDPLNTLNDVDLSNNIFASLTTIAVS